MSISSLQLSIIHTPATRIVFETLHRRGKSTRHELCRALGYVRSACGPQLAVLVDAGYVRRCGATATGAIIYEAVKPLEALPTASAEALRDQRNGANRIHKVSRPATRASKPTHEELAEHVREFLAAGGRITKGPELQPVPRHSPARQARW